MKTILTATLMTIIFATGAFAQWQPAGPIKFLIGFRAGGGADTMARMIAEELESDYGWTVIPENLTGASGGVMARAVKDAPNDGLTLGIAATSTFTYNMLATRNAGYKTEDFDFVATIAGSQLAVVAKANRGWKNMSDVIAAAKSGEEITFGTPTQRLTDGAHYISSVNDVKFNIVSNFTGARGVLDAITAEDIDIGWVTGIQKEGIESGELVNLLNAEEYPLKVSPDAQTLKDIGVEFFFGGTVLIVAPDGLPDESRKAITDAISTVIQKPGTKLYGFINKVYTPKLKIGDEALAFIQSELADSEKLIESTSK